MKFIEDRILIGSASFLILSAQCTCISPEPKPTVGSNPFIYLAQSKKPNGNPYEGVFRCGEQIPYWRSDMGSSGTIFYQLSITCLGTDRAITTWSYNPWNVFDPAAESGCPNSPCRGDGGEDYILAPPNSIYILHTQDGGTNGIQSFNPPWWAFSMSTTLGEWNYGDPARQGRAQLMNLPFPCYGWQTPCIAEAIVSEHFDNPGYSGKLERAIYAFGWGRLVWQEWVPPENPTPTPADLNERCPKANTYYDNPPFDYPSYRLVDCRITTNIVPNFAPITGDQLWRP